MADSTNSKSGFLGYSVGSGASDGLGIEYHGKTPELLDMLHYSGGAANNNVGFGNYVHPNDAAVPRQNIEYGNALEETLGSGFHSDISPEFKAGVQYAVQAILGMYSKQSGNNNSHFPLVPRENSRQIAPVAYRELNSSGVNGSYDSVAHNMTPSRPSLPSSKGRVFEFSDVQVFRKTTVRVWER
jgi:hypothetical protein